MLVKKLVITAAAGALMLGAAVSAGAYYNGANGGQYVGGNYTHTYTKTVTVAHVENDATVNNTTVSVANTGLNFTGANGGTNNANTSTGNAEDGGHFGGISGGAQTQGGALNSVSTGDAGAASVVSNTVNTTSVSF